MLALYLSILKTDADKQLITDVYNLYWRKMMLAATNVTHDKGLAAEAVHESFLKIIKSIEKLRAVAPERRAAWLVAVAVNTAKDILRKEYKSGLPMNNEFWEQQPYVDRVEERNFLLDEIKNLPEKYREPLALYYLFGYGISEIAEMLGISSDNARQRLSRARKMLRERLTENFK